MRFTGSIFFAMMLPALAFSTNYTGQGTWRSTGGDAGDYSVDATIEEQDSFVAISQTLHFGDQVLTMSALLIPKDDTFFDIKNVATDEIVGSGYCFPLTTTGDKVCHSTISEEEYVIESTIKITATAIYRVGSKTKVGSNDKIAWHDVLEAEICIEN